MLRHQRTHRNASDDRARGELVVSKLTKRFGGLTAVDSIDFSVAHGSVLGVIGPNGSGKTTMTNLLTGAYRAESGSARLGGDELLGRTAHRIAALGVARTFQNPRVFKSLTVRQNLALVTLQGESVGVRGLGEQWLDRVGIGHLADRVAHELSGGQQKLIEFARAMTRRPRLVLMDEPFAGVHPDVKRTLRAGIDEARALDGTTFVIVSHEIPDLIQLSDSFLCMAGGRVLLSGDPAAVCADDRVVEAYLGAPLAQAS